MPRQRKEDSSFRKSSVMMMMRMMLGLFVEGACFEDVLTAGRGPIRDDLFS
jgi:hypothetical protein